MSAELRYKQHKKFSNVLDKVHTIYISKLELIVMSVIQIQFSLTKLTFKGA